MPLTTVLIVYFVLLLVDLLAQDLLDILALLISHVITPTKCFRSRMLPQYHYL
jgi:hypothetical protein